MTTVNVMDPYFGAKGDGVSDDTAAFRKALDEINKRKFIGSRAVWGGTVFAPLGVYLVSPLGKIPQHCGIESDSRSTMLLAKPGSVGPMVRLATFHSRIQSICIDCNDQDGVTAGVEMHEAQEMSGVFDCLITRWKHVGIEVVQREDSQYNPQHMSVDDLELYPSRYSTADAVGLWVRNGVARAGSMRHITVNAAGRTSELGYTPADSYAIRVDGTPAFKLSEIHTEHCETGIGVGMSGPQSARGGIIDGLGCNNHTKHAIRFGPYTSKCVALGVTNENPNRPADAVTIRDDVRGTTVTGPVGAYTTA